MRKLSIHFMVLAGTMLCASAASAESFDDVMAYAYDHHPAIKAEEENLKTSHASVLEADAGFLPSATVNYGRGRERFAYEGFDRQYDNTLSESLNVTQPLFNGGGTIASIQAAKSQMRSEEAHLHSTQQSVLLRAIIAYVRMYETQKLLQVNRDNVANLQGQLGSAHARFKAQEVTVSDEAISEARMANGKAQLHNAEGDLAAAHETYLREIGLEPNVSELPPLPPLPQTKEEVLALSEQHPDLLAAEHDKKAAGSTVDTRVAALLPTVSLQGTIQKNEGLVSQVPPFELRDDSVMVQVSIPLFESGAEYARISEAHHQYEHAKDVESDTRLNARQNALQAWDAFQTTKDRLIVNQQAADAAAKALYGIQKEYNSGTRTVFDMLQTQEEIYTAQTDLMRTQADYVVSAYQLLASVGNLSPQAMGLHVTTAQK